jgi:uncharacterized integral membrane protein (TIGR00697 family)
MIRALVVAAAYVAAQMLADITSLKVVVFLGMSMDAGTFIYPITFTLRDLVHKTVGVNAARVLIVTAAAINVVMAVLFWWVARMPGDPAVGPQTAFATVLSPVWRIVVASIGAEVLAELLDTEVYRLWVERITERYQWMRVLLSNAVSVPLPAAVVWSIVRSNVLVKGATTLLSLPLIYAVPESAISDGVSLNKR